MSPLKHITIEENVEYLKRYAFFERAAMRALAGWLPGVPEWDAKNEIGLDVWESADAVDVIYGRLRELRCYQPERNISPVLPQIASAFDESANTAEVIATVYLVVKKQLLEALRTHPEATWSDFDNPTVKVAEQLIPSLERQVAWADAYFPTIAANYPGWEAWRDYVVGLLAADGGISGAGEKSEAPARPEGHALLLPWMECQRMPDWPIFKPEEDIQPDRETDPEGYRLWRFKHYTNEMTAAETLGSILWMTPEMIWEYQHNVARHLWDELRHSQLGQTRVQQLGLKLNEIPQVVQIYNVMMTLPAVEQYALLTTVIEPNGMPEKTTNREHWEALEDEISAAAVSYDWSDENFHVRWGQKWTPVLLKTYNYPETPDEIRVRMEAWMLENTPVKMQQNHAHHEY
ncbi:MAG: hypothetical protein UZ15_CFX003002881 [Chloroflexi bacterium OLB15]|nr:MAG: hypothetical protein UZ15_CFX003002881 [Chloroflexi bacterium OLB15]